MSQQASQEALVNSTQQRGFQCDGRLFCWFVWDRCKDTVIYPSIGPGGNAEDAKKKPTRSTPPLCPWWRCNESRLPLAGGVKFICFE